MHEYMIPGAGSARCAPAVVEERLRGRCIDGSRVMDTSIMPSISTGTTNVAAIRIGEQLSELILRNPLLAPSNVYPLQAP